MFACDENSMPVCVPGPLRLWSRTGLKAKYQGPICLSMMGRISSVQVSSEYELCW